MSKLFAKLYIRGNNCKYRKVLSTPNTIYPAFTTLVEDSVPYDPTTILDSGEWYAIEQLSAKTFSIDVTSEEFDTVDFDSLTSGEFKQIDFVFTQNGDDILFQNVSKAKLVQKKAILHVGERFEYDDGYAAITINDSPDAIYKKSNDTLYFRKLASITSVFKGIDQLYREATQEETTEFLGQNFINLVDDFTTDKVKTANRRRIALAVDTLSHLSDYERPQVFSYIGEYCPDLNPTGNSFDVRSEGDLKLLLYGIEQRFYTTPVGGEKRIANSIIKMNQEGTTDGQAQST